MTQEDSQIRVAIVDDHAMVREGLRAFLQYAPDIQIVAEVSTGTEAIEVCAHEDVDVVLMDLVMPGQYDGIAATRHIKNAHQNVHVIALTSFQDLDKTLSVIEAGAISYLQKDVNPDDLLYAIRQASLGRTVLEPLAMEALRQAGRQEVKRGKHISNVSGPSTHALPPPAPLIESLTRREQEVLEAMALGMSNKEIAAALGITEKTAKVHVSHILGKLGVYDRTQAVIVATKLGFIRLT